jgi:2-succinyl-5-enolpyruvyl-6-hydroxy-3-cyclohexene-1-carboxylate synthase
MKKKINRNIIWTNTFISILESSGIKYACISPGSRSTPLTYAVIISGIKSFVHVDERSSGFFATGLARKTATPVILICTSGTAAAEFYPAIIEAYQQRIPLIICTADRPSGAYLKGINQTINQDNLYNNHVQWFTDAGLPDPSDMNKIKSIAIKTLDECYKSSRPVHINFPFDKPFEPDSYTDESDEQDDIPEYSFNIKYGSIPVEDIAHTIITEPNGIITVGPSQLSSDFRKSIIQLSENSGYPILADGVSQLRFCGEISPSIFTNYDAIIKSGYFIKNKPSLILHFGRNMTSKAYEDFLKIYNGRKYIINKYGSIFDPAGRYDAVITADEYTFTADLNNYLEAYGFNRRNSEWFPDFARKESEVCRIKKEVVYNSGFPDEGRIIPEIIRMLPEKINIMVSNSTPVRDFDYFSEQTSVTLNIYHNRGASGIDGIISTALGIAASGEKTLLITGDLAFYHDMNGLIAAKKYNLPLIIVLINNNGGGIFRALPVAKQEEIYDTYFNTPHNLNFKKFTDAYEVDHKLIENWDDLRNSLKKAMTSENLTVLEIQTDAEKSLQNRRLFWEKVKEKQDDTGTF